MKSIAVFCGSSEGYDEYYREMAFTLGSMLAERGIRLVYGGARVGLMGAIADGCLQSGGEVIGVIPKFLETKEITHPGLTELVLVETMHERKVKMHELSDGVIAMPGGWGTMDETIEMLTWGQLGLHSKPIGLLNVNGFYDALQAFFSNMVTEGFLQECTHNIVLMSASPEELLTMMGEYVAPDVTQWLTKQTT